MKIVKRSCSRYFLCIYRHSPTYAIVTLPTGGSGASRMSVIHTVNYIVRGFLEIHAPNWIPIGRSMTAPSSVLSPCSILPPPFLHCAFIPITENGALIFKTSCLLFCFFFNRLSLKLRNLKIRKSGSVSKYILPKCEQCVLAGRFRC